MTSLHGTNRCGHSPARRRSGCRRAAPTMPAFASLPGVELVGIVDPLAAHRTRAVQMLGCRTFGDVEEMLDLGSPSPSRAHPSVSRGGAGLIARKARSTCWWKADRLVGRGTRDRRSRARGRRDADGRPCRALQPRGRRHQAGDQGRGNSPSPPGGAVPAAHVHVGVVIDLAVHDIDLIRVHRIDIARRTAATRQRVAEREDIALLQFRHRFRRSPTSIQLADAVRRAASRCTRGKYVQGDSLTRAGHRMFGFQRDGSHSMRHLSVGFTTSVARRAGYVPRRGARRGAVPAVTGEEGVASLEIAIKCLTRWLARSPCRCARDRARSLADAGGAFPEFNGHHEISICNLTLRFFIDVAASRRLGAKIDAVALSAAHRQFINLSGSDAARS